MAYTKQTWVKREKVASAKLNHIEQGLYDISKNGAIDTANLAPAAVTNDKIDQEAVDSPNIRYKGITADNLADGCVTKDKLGNDIAITNAQIDALF